MKFNKDTGKITVSAREFVRIAKRGISPTPSRDEDEAAVSLPRRESVISKVPNIPTKSNESIVLEFDAAGHNFELIGTPYAAIDDKVYLVARVETSTTRPEKELVSILRAEGFINAYIQAKKHGYASINITFIYINEELEEYNRLDERVNTKKLNSFFERCKLSVALYATPEVDRVTKRLPSLSAMKFPYKEIRDAQREFMYCAYRTISHGGQLIAEAPTGTGKTVSALYPALRALGKEKCDKIFYFTPKTTTAEAVKDCLERMADCGASVRGVILSAKERTCASGMLCKDDRALCKNCKCNKLPDAALELYKLGKTVVTRTDAVKISKEFSVCPYELMLTYSELADVVVCDFNYLFDPGVYIRRYFTEGGNYAFLFDEAHNLPDRAQNIFSHEISEEDIAAPLFSDLLGEFSDLRGAIAEFRDTFREALYKLVKDELRKKEDGTITAAAHVREFPDAMYGVVKLISLCEVEIFKAYNSPDEMKAERIKLLRRYYYRLKKFYETLERYDDCYETFIFLEGGCLRMKLFCTDTGGAIAERLRLGSSAVFFSATLTPLYYYRAVLGLDKSADTLEVDSPFDRGQVSISVMDKISTRSSEREDTLLAVCRAIAATVSAKRGNYMVFSPSFAYAEALAKLFSAKYPKINTVVQKRGATPEEKAEFLEKFRDSEDKSYLIGFSVMGGVFSEGIDLAGDSLIGAVIVGIGMPALTFEREAMRAYFDEKYEEGMQFAYIYPGMNKVLQAGGRVIRREDDFGVIVLIDDRFDDPIYKKNAPKLWGGMKFIPDAKTLREELDKFWENADEVRKRQRL